MRAAQHNKPNRPFNISTGGRDDITLCDLSQDNDTRKPIYDIRKAICCCRHPCLITCTSVVVWLQYTKRLVYVDNRIIVQVLAIGSIRMQLVRPFGRIVLHTTELLICCILVNKLVYLCVNIICHCEVTCVRV